MGKRRRFWTCAACSQPHTKATSITLPPRWMSVPATLATKRLVTLQCCSVACVDTLRVSVALLRGPGGSADASQALARLVARVRVYMRVDKPSRRYPGFVNMLDLHRVLESHRAAPTSCTR